MLTKIKSDVSMMTLGLHTLIILLATRAVCQLKNYFEILTGKTLTDCEEPAVSSETEAGGSDPASQI